MTTLAEIEAAADQLPAEQHLAARLHTAGGPLPPPRDLPLEKIQNWIAEDEASMQFVA